MFGGEIAFAFLGSKIARSDPVTATLPLVRDPFVVQVGSHTGKDSSCSITQLLSRPKVSTSHCAISQEPFFPECA